MASAGTLVKQILNEINVRESEAPLQADETQDTIFNMNSYMLAQAANGIDLGYTAVSDLGDTVTVPDGALMGIVANVAIMMAPTFGKQVSQALVVKAKTGLAAMRKLGVTITASNYPAILPIGSGNEDDDSYNSKFYPDQDSTILGETGGAIGLETGT